MAEKDYKTYTEHYKLVKPGDLEKYDIEEVTRTNADIIDAELKKHEIAINNLHNYDDTLIKKDIAAIKKEQEDFNTAINNLDTTVQNITMHIYQIKVTTEIKELTEYELPCQYTVRKWRYRNILQ